MKIASIIKRTIIAVMFSCINQLLFAQQGTDGKFIFKTWFFLERENENFRLGNKFDIKDSSLFDFMNNVIDLKIDTLKSKWFEKDFIFLSIAQYKNDVVFHDSAITYKKFDSKGIKEVHVGIPISYCNGYVLCINKNSGRSFRIQGFYGNDILSLIDEVKEEDKKNNKKVVSTNYFLNNYEVDGIDLKCIYKGVKAGGNATKKYPCLIKCSDFKVVVY